MEIGNYLKNPPVTLTLILITVAFFSFSACMAEETPAENNQTEDTISLPSPKKEGTVSVEKTLDERRSVRDLKSESIDIKKVSQLVWAGQGISDEQRKLRTAPSAGALYGLNLYISIHNVSGIEPGIYRYIPEDHSLKLVKQGDHSSKITEATGQYWMENAPAIILISGVYSRLEQKYGDRAERYTILEAGHAAQNICLQLVSLDLATTTVGAFSDNKIKEVSGMDSEEQPLYVMPVGIPAE